MNFRDLNKDKEIHSWFMVHGYEFLILFFSKAFILLYD